MSKPFPYPIIISGAGPAGLLLGHALKGAGIAFKIYEKDSSLTKRSQGYRFKIHGEGVLALSDTLQPNQFNLLRQTDGRFHPGFGARLDAVTAEARPGMPPPMDAKVDPITADRSTFRRVLAIGLEEYIYFGEEIVGFDTNNDTLYVVAQFADGTKEKASLLVAADGAWSKIRQQKASSLTPMDTGCRAFYGKTPITPAFTATFNSAALQGMSSIVDNSAEHPVSLFLEPMTFDPSVASTHPDLHIPQDYVYWVLGSNLDRFEALGWQDSRTPASADDCVSFIHKLVEKWHPSIKALFDAQSIPQTSIIRIGSMLPDLTSWESSRVTLIGDAAHVMSPISGAGAGNSLRDAALLGRLLGQVQLDKDYGVVEAVAEYESAMKEYVRESITWSAGPSKKLFGMKDVSLWQPFAA